jgi:hypothetical protein
MTGGNGFDIPPKTYSLGEMRGENRLFYLIWGREGKSRKQKVEMRRAERKSGKAERLKAEVRRPGEGKKAEG